MARSPAVFFRVFPAMLDALRAAVRERPSDCSLLLALKEKLYKRSELLLARRAYGELRGCYEEVQRGNGVK